VKSVSGGASGVVRFVQACLVVAGALATPRALEAATGSGPFHLAPGHAARPAFYFVVGGPGTVSVHVQSSVAEPVTVTVYAGPAAIDRARGEKDVRLTIKATPEHLASGHEWAVIVSGSTTDTTGDGRISVEFPDDRRPAPSHPVDAYLRQHPALGFHLTWNEQGRVTSHSAWPSDLQAALRAAFDDLEAGRPSSLPDPPPNAWRRAADDDQQALHTAFAPDTARALYAATVAHSLRVDMKRLVPWPLADLNGDELDALLASTSLFWWNADQRAYEISEFDHGWAAPAAPQAAWAFLNRERLVRSTRLETITAMVGWAGRLTHFAGPVSRDNFRDHWGYDGDMPVSRALGGTRYAGTVFASMPGYDQTRHYTAGCQGTAGLFASVLRAANIPVRPRSVSNDSTPHATVLFLSEDRALTHGDDPYSLLVEGADPAELLVDMATYDKWLGPRSKDAGRYIGRQALAVGLERLPPIVRRTHERDRQQGLAPEQSGVYTLFKGSYFMAELQEVRLWERLEAARAGDRPSAAGAAGASSDAWVEAETAGVNVSAGAVDAQDLDPALLGMWRGQRQLRWQGARPGAELSVPFQIADPGTYRLSVRFTRAPSYAIVAIRLDDEATTLDRVSLYAPQMVAADPLSMGEHALSPGPHRLRFTIVGAHPEAEPGYVVGIDAIRLERLR
jgi:hypothetical protein